ncbi:MAG: T9SS type A sorting domain-containing protein, partial [Candidatus Stahlbacteria bacterium]
GNVYVTGYSDGLGTHDDYATVKYSTSGVEQWVARYDGLASGVDEPNAVAIDDTGNVYVTGYSAGSGTGYDYATVKYNPSGTEQWVARYDGPESYWDIAYAMAIDGAGNVYVTGRSCSSETSWDYTTVKYSQGPGVAEASPDVPGHRLEVAQLTPEPVITYTLSSSSSISLKIYDVTGKLVRTLVSGSQGAGTHTACWDARNDSNQQVPAGLYFILLETADYRATGKLVVVR